MPFNARILTPDEVQTHFNHERATINWGVCEGDEPVIYFSAEPEDDGWLNVHIHAKRRRVHPRLVLAFTRMMIARLFALGAAGLKAEIAPSNKASLRLARNAGFQQVAANEEWITLALKAGYDKEGL